MKRGHIRVGRETGIAAAIFVVTAICYGMTVSTTIVNTDAAANSLTAWRIAHTGQPWMDGLDLNESGVVPHYGVGRDGHIVTTRTPGQIWVAVPFYVGSGIEQSDASYARGGLVACLLTAACVSFMFVGIYRLRVNLLVALGATAVFAFATPVWSTSANALWTHPLTLFGIGGAVLALTRERWWLVGFFLGVGMTARLHIAIIAAVIGLGFAWSRKSPTIAVRVAVPTLASLGLLSAWSYYVFGSWDPRGAYSGHELGSVVPAVSDGTSGFLENLAGFLVSPDRGMLVWTPLLGLLLPAVVRGWARSPEWTRWLATGGVFYGVAQVGLNVFHGGDGFFGYRLGLEVLASVTPLFVSCAGEAGRLARTLAPVIIGIQAGAFFLGALEEWMPIDQDQVWRDNTLIHALREHPSEIAPIFAVVAVAWALAAQLMIVRSGRDTNPEATDDAIGQAGAQGAAIGGRRRAPDSRVTR